MRKIINFMMVAALLMIAGLAFAEPVTLVITLPALGMAGACTIDEGTERDCDIVGPGGVARLFAIDRSYLVNAQLGIDKIVKGLTLTPTKKFWELYIKPEFESTFMNSPTTQASAGAVLADILLQFHLQDTPKNQVWRDKFINTSMVFVSVDRRGQWRIAGLGDAGIAYEQTTQLGTGQVAADRPELIITGTAKEHPRYGVLHFIIPIPVWALASTYAVGDIVSKDISGTLHYYESLQAANTGNDPATAFTYWNEISRLEAEGKNTRKTFLTQVN